MDEVSRYKLLNLQWLLSDLYSKAVSETCDKGQISRLLSKIETAISVLRCEISSVPTGSERMKDASLKLLQLQAIYDFDLKVRQDPHNTFALTLKNAELTQLQQWKALYTSNVNERESMNQRDINEPLLDILSDVGDESLKRKGKAKHVVLFRYLKLPEVREVGARLIKVAMQDIFRHELSAIQGIVEGLRLTKDGDEILNLSLDRLILCHKLAGFFYNQKAVEYLIKISDFISSSIPVSEWIIRLAILRFLQVAGEFFQRILPSTLNLHEDLPGKEGLEVIRNKLSHLNRDQLDSLLDESKETATFEQVKNDISIRLLPGLQRILKKYESWCKQLQTPHQSAALWSELKDPSKQCSSTLSNPFQGLHDLLKPSSPSPKTDSPYRKELEELLPFPYDSPTVKMIEDYIKQRKYLMDVIGQAKTEYRNAEDLLKNIEDTAKEIGAQIRPVTAVECESFRNQLISLNKERGLPCTDIKTKDAKEADISEHKNEFLNKLMGISREEHAAQEEKNTKIVNIKNIQDRAEVELKNMRPFDGVQNISNRYADFVKKLKRREVPIERSDSVYSWFSEPTSKVEQLFHKVHKTGITTKDHKDRFRSKRIREVLKVVELLRKKVDIKTDLALKIKKESHLHNLRGIEKQTEVAARSLKEHQPEAEKNIKELQDDFLVEKQCLQTMESENADEILHEKENRKKLLTRLRMALTQEKFSDGFDCESWLQDLESSGRSNCYCRLALCIEFGKVKTNYRLHTPPPCIDTMQENLKLRPIVFLAYEFFVAAIYEMLKEINDYPELSCLEDTDRIRNHFFHSNPFNDEQLLMEDVNQDLGGNIYSNDPSGELAKEIAILSINVKFLLEVVADHLNSTA